VGDVAREGAFGVEGTTEPAGGKNATLSVTDVGTQSSALSGMADFDGV